MFKTLIGIIFSIFLMISFTACNRVNKNWEIKIYTSSGDDITGKVENFDLDPAFVLQSENLIGYIDQIKLWENTLFIHSRKSQFPFYSLNLETKQLNGFGEKGRGKNEVTNSDLCKIVHITDSSLVYLDLTPEVKEYIFDSDKIKSYYTLINAIGLIQNMQIDQNKLVQTAYFKKGHVAFGVLDHQDYKYGSWDDLEFLNNVKLEGLLDNYVKTELSLCKNSNIVAMTNMNTNDILVYSLDGEFLYKILVDAKVEKDGNVIYYQNVRCKDGYIYGLFNGYSTSFRDIFLDTKSEIHKIDVKSGHVKIYKSDRLLRDFDINTETNQIIAIDDGNDNSPFLVYDMP